MSRRPVDIRDKQVLDLVAAGESNGDYNAVYGIRVGSSQQPDFSRMTITEVQQYQRDRISGGQSSSAVGKYQFIQSTLKETTERAGFNPDTTYFTPQVQDQLMTTRLDQRGLSRWKNNRMTDTQFQDSLAKEFASVPVATAQRGAHGLVGPGQSYYDGDGINSAEHVNGTQFRNSLNQINNESGTSPVNANVTSPTIPYRDRLSVREEQDLARRAVMGNEQAEAEAELFNEYKLALQDYVKNNPGKSPYEWEEINNQMMSNEMSDSPIDRKKAEIFNKAADAVQADLDKQDSRTPNNTSTSTSITVTEGNVIDELETYRAGSSKRSPEPNWYTSVNLPTYRWTLYLTDDTAFDDPASNLMTDSPSPDKAVIIAQDGVEATYTIDNFLFNAVLFGDDTKGSAQTSTIQFELREPMGFTLLDAILTQSGRFGFATMKDAKYVLKLEFVGRDPKTDRIVKYDGVHFFPIQPYNITSDTGPEGTVYSFICLSIPAISALENTTTSGEVHVNDVTTLRELVDKLEANLIKAERLAISPVNINTSDSNQSYLDEAFGNREQAENNELIIPRKTWQIEFDDTTKQIIEGVGSIDRAESGNTTFDLENMPISLANSSGTGKSLEDENKINTVLPKNSNVVSWLKNFIVKQPAWNQYVKDATKSGYTTPAIEITQSVKTTPGRENQTDNNTQQKYITTVITVGIKQLHGVIPPDSSNTNQLNDKVFQKNRFEKLPIVKKYEYLFTGKNTEVLNYSAQFNMLFTLAKDPRYGANTANSQQDKQSTNPTQPIFLSDISVPSDPYNVISNLPNEYVTSTGISQQTNEDTPTQNELFAQYIQNFAARTSDQQVIEVDVIGDPYLLGIPGATFTGKESQTLKNVNASSDIFVAFLSYFPLNKNSIDNPFDKGPMDVYTSGVYELREVEHRFQQGQYVTKLRMYRDHRSSTFFIREELENL